MMASSQLLSANCGFIAIALCESRFSSRSLSANHGFITVALSGGIVAIALAIRGIRAIALANRRVFIAIALSESRRPRDRSRESPGIIAIALGESQHPRDRSRESPGLEGKRRRCLRRQREVTVNTDYYNSDLTV